MYYSLPLLCSNLTAFSCRFVPAPGTTALSPQGHQTRVYGNARRFVEIVPGLQFKSRSSKVAKIEIVYL
jgi:hypothetical protein